jgi:hypothetical protein
LNLYGSSRLGMWLPNIEMDGSLPEHYDGTEIGTRNYEFTNHLGNVMAVVTDKLSFNGSYWEAQGSLSVQIT